MEPIDASAGELWCFPLVFFPGACCGVAQIDAEELHGAVEGHLLVWPEPKVLGIGGPRDREGMCLTVP